MFEIWECVIINNDIEPLILVDRVDDIETAKIMVEKNKNYIIWDNINQVKL